MAKYGSKDLVIKVDNSAGTLVDLTQYIDTINEVNVGARLQDATTFGDQWVEQIFTGLREAQPVTIEGFYDDTATSGPDAVLYGGGAALGQVRTLEITWGGTKTTTVETVITNYVRRATRGELTRFTCTLTPTGAVTEA